MLEALQAWVADYYTRTGPWSYEEHRRIFDSYTGRKVEYAGPALQHRAHLSPEEAMSCSSRSLACWSALLTSGLPKWNRGSG